jgi:hypothetical protein
MMVWDELELGVRVKQRVRRQGLFAGVPGACVSLACLVIVVVIGVSAAGCGYHVAGTTSALPQNIHTIAVPALENKTTSYRIEQRLTAATIHEFVIKTPYHIVSDPANGDAVLRGKVLTLEAVPLLYSNTTTANPTTSRATTMLVTVKCELTLEDRVTGKILYHTDNFQFRNEYEISTDVTSFFEEQDPALERLARDFATRLVAAVTENY